MFSGDPRKRSKKNGQKVKGGVLRKAGLVLQGKPGLITSDVSGFKAWTHKTIISIIFQLVAIIENVTTKKGL